MAVDKENEHRVLAIAPNGRDARATCEILGSIGIAATICADMGDLCRELDSGAGAVLLTNDSLVPEGAVAALAAALRTQPQWSDLPVLLLASGGANSAIALEVLEALPNVLVLDRPVHLPTLVSAARTMLRSRKRQYELRDHLQELKRTEEALFRAKEQIETDKKRLEAILEAIPTAIVLVDASGKFAYNNKRALELYGCSYADVDLQAHLAKVKALKPDGAPYPSEEIPVSIALKTGKAVPSAEMLIHRSDGARIPVLVNAAPLRDAQDNITAAVAAFEDVSELKQAQYLLQQQNADLEERVAKRTAEVGRERQRFFDVLETLPVMVTLIRPDYHIAFANRAYREALGESNGRRCFDYQFGRDKPCEECQAFLPLKTGQPHRWEWTLPDGRTFDINNFPFADADDSPMILEMDIDITEQRRAEAELRELNENLERRVTERTAALAESERRFREVLENSLDAAYRRDLRTDTYDYVSPVVKQVFKIEPDVLRSMSLAGLAARIHPDDIKEVERAIEQSMVTGSGRLDYRFLGDDGQYRWLADHFTVLKDGEGNPIARGGIVREITELRRAQDALKENDRRKDEFLAMLGHELRNPLAAITTGIRLLRSPDAERHQWVKESLDRQTRQLIGLVDDLLDISRITRGKIQLRSEVVDLARIAEGAAESAADLIAEKKHALAISCAAAKLPVLGDPTRLQQIIANLLNNAAKYTMDGGRIDLTLTLEGNEAVVCVRDNGMGIPADMQESIFDLFGQVDSAMHRPQQGLGIGLNLVKMLVELHGGKVAVSSEGDGKGSQFTVRLPAVEWPKELENRGGSGESVEEEFFDVLVVEDNREAARMLGAVLAGKGHTVRMAENGLTALELAAERQPDLVVLDIGLPDITGYEVAEKLRQELGYDATLIIAATGYGQEKDRQRSRQAGIDHHLVKPVQYETLTLLAREWRRTARGRRRIVRPFFQAEAIDARPERSVRILVIDDTRAIARITQRMLQQEGHMVEVAFDGPSGIEAARSFRPALILCDISLPGASGFEVLKAVRADPALDGVVVAALTGYSEDEDKQRTKQAGFDVHLVKPVSLEQLQALVRQMAN